MSCQNPRTPLTMIKGRTFSKVVRWEAGPVVYKVITNITKAGPAVVTAASHGIVDGWRVAITDVVGMDQINAAHNPPRTNEFLRATYIDADSFSLNAVDSQSFDTYVSGGLVRYNTPVDLSAATAQLVVKDMLGGTTLLTLANGVEVVVDDAAKTITVTVDAAAVSALTFSSGVYELAATIGSVVTVLLEGDIEVLEGVS